ncbi:hypothetical protein H6G20_11275 [Desertifilum sp. FACHB-1129]|uniref:Uncharacterized protein n=2 Tax=Desertifilaceae TaxID=1969992 RepID=A0A1E5QQZ0_9CYAN|nr:hypothetical protein [Desertifilum sp. FACHB-1129]OEJ77072.1 hypothetical protein BH720_01180 [Desertifilum tharense IPPAS B-1220]
MYINAFGYINNNWEFRLTNNGSRPIATAFGCSWDDIPSIYFHCYENDDPYIDSPALSASFKTVYCSNIELINCPLEEDHQTKDCNNIRLGEWPNIDDYTSQEEREAKIVWQIGYELISLVNGAFLLFDDNFRKVEIAELRHNGSLMPYCNNLKSMKMLGKPDIPEEIIQAQLTSEMDDRLKLIHKATEDEGVWRILKYFEMGKDWATYFKIFETIKKGKKFTDEEKRFKKTANNYSLSGINSRHGFKPVEIKPPSMTIDEAHIFIRNLAKEYLMNKIK